MRCRFCLTDRMASKAKKGSGSFFIRLTMDPSPKRIAKRFEHLRNELNDLRPAWDRLIPYLRREMSQVFARQQAGTNKEWAQWSDAYSARRKAGSVLVDKGRLKRKLTTKGVRSKTKKRLKFGVLAPGARALQFGYRQRNLQPRTYVAVTQEMEDTAAHVVNDHIGRVIDRAVIPPRRAGK